MKKLLQFTLLTLLITRSQVCMEPVETNRSAVQPQHQLSPEQIQKANNAAIKQVASDTKSGNATPVKYQTRINELQGSGKSAELEKNYQSLSLSLGATPEQALQQAQAAHGLAKHGSIDLVVEPASPNSVTAIDSNQQLEQGDKGFVDEQVNILNAKTINSPINQPEVVTIAKKPSLFDDGTPETDNFLDTNTARLNKKVDRSELFKDTTPSNVTKITENNNPTIGTSLERINTESPLIAAKDIQLSDTEQQESNRLEENVTPAQIDEAAQNPQAAQTLAENTADQAADAANLTPEQRQSLKEQARQVMKNISKTVSGWFSDFCKQVTYAVRVIKQTASNGYDSMKSTFSKPTQSLANPGVKFEDQSLEDQKISIETRQYAGRTIPQDQLDLYQKNLDSQPISNLVQNNVPFSATVNNLQ